MARGLMVVLAFAATAAQAQEAAKADGGADVAPAAEKSITDKLADCDFVTILLNDGVIALRSYPAPPSPRDASGANGWDQVPYVAAVHHCGQLYIIRIESKSKEPWIIKDARVEEPKGEKFQVYLLSFVAGKRSDINGFAVEAPPGARISSLKLNLTGADGRAARIDAKDLP